MSYLDVILSIYILVGGLFALALISNRAFMDNTIDEIAAKHGEVHLLAAYIAFIIFTLTWPLVFLWRGRRP